MNRSPAQSVLGPAIARYLLLSTYMGDVSIVSTERYLHFIDELASQASDRFDAQFGAAVVPLTKARGDR
jgi:hypothetical protein